MQANMMGALSADARRYVSAVTGKTPEELSALNPEDEIALSQELRGSAPVWGTDYKGSFRGRGNVNVAHRRLKTLEVADAFLDELVKKGVRQY